VKAAWSKAVNSRPAAAIPMPNVLAMLYHICRSPGSAAAAYRADSVLNHNLARPSSTAAALLPSVAGLFWQQHVARERRQWRPDRALPHGGIGSCDLICCVQLVSSKSLFAQKTESHSSSSSTWQNRQQQLRSSAEFEVVVMVCCWWHDSTGSGALTGPYPMGG
jgi:hypothetical protein